MLCYQPSVTQERVEFSRNEYLPWKESLPCLLKKISFRVEMILNRFLKLISLNQKSKFLDFFGHYQGASFHLIAVLELLRSFSEK